jgi:transcriptional regulator with XRE-family HTH domain
MERIYTGRDKRLMIGSRGHPLTIAGVEDQRLGSAVRAIRVRRGWRQIDACAAAGISRGAAMRIEAGDLEAVAFGDVRRYARALGARFEGLLRWHGADLDRLLNRGHALLHEAMARWLRDIGGWLSLPEVSFSHRGDRGVIDIVAWHAASRTLLVIELKTRIADVNELMSTMDIRRRVAPIIAREHGWEPLAVGIWVLVAPARTNARAVADHAVVLRAKFPADGRSMRRWLAVPAGDIAALSFMPQVRLNDLRHSSTTPLRVRRRSASVGERSRGLATRREPRFGVTFHD